MDSVGQLLDIVHLVFCENEKSGYEEKKTNKNCQRTVVAVCWCRLDISNRGVLDDEVDILLQKIHRIYKNKLAGRMFFTIVWSVVIDVVCRFDY